MHTLRSVLFLVLALAAALAAAQPEDPQVRKEIERHYEKWDRLVAKGDVNGLMAMIDPSFTATDKNGRVTTYRQVKAQFASMLKTFREPKSKITVNQIQSQGQEVVAWVAMTVSFKMKQGEKWAPQTFTVKFAETLKKKGGEWKFLSSQELL